MELKIAAVKLDKTARQRNLFIGLCCVVVLANLLLSFKLFSMEERVVMVPGISAEMSVTGGRVSRNYLEETSLLFLSALLDLTPDTVGHKRNMVLKYSSGRSLDGMQSIKDYFANAEKEHQKFDMSTYFTPKTIEANPNSLEVVAHGTLSAFFGKNGKEEKPVSYYLAFELAAGHLKLKEFYLIKEAKTKG